MGRQLFAARGGHGLGGGAERGCRIARREISAAYFFRGGANPYVVRPCSIILGSRQHTGRLERSPLVLLNLGQLFLERPHRRGRHGSYDGCALENIGRRAVTAAASFGL